MANVISRSIECLTPSHFVVFFFSKFSACVLIQFLSLVLSLYVVYLELAVHQFERTFFSSVFFSFLCEEVYESFEKQSTRKNKKGNGNGKYFRQMINSRKVQEIWCDCRRFGNRWNYINMYATFALKNKKMKWNRSETWINLWMNTKRYTLQMKKKHEIVFVYIIHICKRIGR